MKHYIWFHTNYVKESRQDIIIGQKNNAKAHHYTVLNDDELHKVNTADHFTIVGHTTEPPKNGETELGDTGLYLQGDDASECINKLKQLGLASAPKIVTLESCSAALPKGIAQELSKQPFFKYSVIEANTGAVGRNPGGHWSLPTDSLGRSIISSNKSFWVFYLQGYEVARHSHDSYDLEHLLEQIAPNQFQERFFSNYHPGIFGGRVGRYCANKTPLSLAKALFFAQGKTNSATADALNLTLEQIYAH